ncbi:MAG TPA: serine hydrolase domain-containing protein [Candidatus Limnocylindrales bacterium]
MTAGHLASRVALAAVFAIVAGCGSGVPSLRPGSATTPTVATTPTENPTVAPTDPPPTRAPWTLFPAYPTATLDGATAGKLQAILDDLVSGGYPDAVAAVVTADGTWAGAAGIDGPDGRLADPSDMFNIASVSKPILAALVLRLAQDGKVDLDAPLANYLDEVPVVANGATVRQALQMRAGYGDTPASAAEASSADCRRVWSRADTLVSLPETATKPGGIFRYSNPSYKLLGYAAEEVSGMPLDAAFDEQLFGPLGLDRILLQTADRKTPKPWAVPIGKYGGGLDLDAFGTGGTLPCVSLSTFSFSTSAVASDAPSLARWAWGLFAGELIDRSALEQMTTPFDGGHAMGIELLPDFRPNLAYGVHGGNAGYAAFLTVLPERQAVAVVFVNFQEAEVQGAARDLLLALAK